MSEHSPQPEQLSKQHLATLVKDFYFSFRFSQGGDVLQAWLYKGLVSVYDKHLLDAVCVHETSIYGRLSSLRLPKEHLPAKPGSVKWEFQKQASRFLDEAIIARDHPELQELSPKTTAQIVDKMIDSDLLFLKPNAEKLREHSKDDQYKSYFREYILSDTPTGSDSFDALFGDIRHAIIDKKIDRRALTRLDELVNVWEMRHPDETFAPGD